MLSRIPLVLSCLTLLLCVGCTLHSPATTYVFGPTSATGTLIRADVSLVRRGTHSLLIDRQRVYFLESKTVDLRSYEGQTVTLTGTLEPNSSPTNLPVLVVTAAERIIGKEDLHAWKIPALGIQMEAPLSWQGNIRGERATFSLPGETEPLLTIERSSGSILPDGTPLYIQNRKSSLVRSGTLAETVSIVDQDTVLSLRFDPTKQDIVRSLEEGEVLAGQFQAVLGSIVFLRDQHTELTATGSISGTPCGGPAGILCSAGSYCDIVDAVNQVGRCKGR